MPPGDPEKCRMYAARYFRLSKTARTPERRDLFLRMAETWARLAAETEADEALLRTLLEFDFGPDAAEILPTTLKLSSWPGKLPH